MPSKSRIPLSGGNRRRNTPPTPPPVVGSILGYFDFEPTHGATGSGGTNTTQAGNLGWEQYDSSTHFWVWQSYEANVVPNSRYPSDPPTLPSGSNYAARFELRDPTDEYFGLGTGQRAQLMAGTGGVGQSIQDGTEQWWGFSIYLPASWTELGSGTGNHWYIPFQFHMEPGGGEAPISLILGSQSVPQTAWTNNSDLKWRIALNQGTDPNGFNYTVNSLVAANKGSWEKFVFHVVHSSNPAIGLTEIWVNDTQRISQNHRTMYPATTNAMQIGSYREGTITGSQVHYLSQIKCGTSYAVVAP